VLLIIVKKILILEIHDRFFTWRLSNLVALVVLLLLLMLLFILISWNLGIKIAIGRLFFNGSESVSALKDRLTS
jgi:hypothetical protein